MDRRSWLWRRKSSEKSTGETESSGGSVSSHSERYSDDQVYLNQNSQSLEVTSIVDPPRPTDHNHVVKTLSEKLSEALLTIKAKEQLVNQHAKVAEEAVSGWEKAEKEVLALRQQVEVLTVRNATLEDRVGHLDEALKECMRQLRQTREEKDQIANEALEKKISESESSLTSVDANLYHKLEMCEKENLDLKDKILSMAEELEIRVIERDLSNQAAEQASKLVLDSVKKAAKLEAECRRLNSVLQKASIHQLQACKMPSVTENRDLKEICRFGRSRMDSCVEIDLMNDFLEMERLVALPGSSEVDERIKKVESLEIALKERENELKASRNQLEESESKLRDYENELQESRNRLEEAESKLAECENELKASRYQLEEAESKLNERENELKALRNPLEDAESKLSKYENELKASRNQLEEAESKLHEQENELKASRNRLKESEIKLADRENELKSSRTRLEEAEFKLAEHENELKLSRHQLEKAESKLAELEIELNASTYLLEEAEFKLHNTTNRLEMSEARLEAAYVKKEEAESRCKALESEIETLVSKVNYFENNIQKERDLSRQTEAKYQDLKDEVSRLQQEAQNSRSENQTEEFRSLKTKQDKELALAGSKFAECQKTIASLNRQLQALATLDDFLIGTNSL